MKHIITLLAIVLASTTLSACSKKYDEYGLNCKVKSVLEQSYSMTMKFGEPAKEYRVQNELMEFNENGQMVSKNIYYDYESDELELREKEIYKYNDNGLLVEMDEYRGDGSYSGKETYEYNDLGLKTNEYWYDSDNKVSYHYHMEYNDAGNETLYVSYDNGHENWRHEKTYNNNNFLISEVSYEKGKLWCTSEWTWDEDKLISIKNIFGDGRVIIDNPELFKLTWNENGLPINSDHDDWGNVTYEYVTFDKKGNWTKRIAHGSEYSYITEREITY